MSKRFSSKTLLAMAIFGVLSYPQLAQAHEKWFVNDPNSYQVDYSLIFSWPVLLGIIISGLALAGITWADRWYYKRLATHNPNPQDRLAGLTEQQLQKLYGFLPLVLALHIAVPLLVDGFQLELFAPNLKMQPNLLSGVLALAEFLIALALIYGVFTDLAALSLIGLYVVGLIVGPLVGIQQPLFLLEHLLTIGIAFFLYVFGRGPISVDALIGRHSQPNWRMIKYAIPVIRWTTGLSLIILAFTEKLLDPSLANAFLTQKIDFNFGSSFGMSDLYFTYAAGIVELMFGVLLISGKLPRLVVMIAWVPFNLTLPFLGWTELVWHLPIYGIMLILLILGPGNRVVFKRSALTLARTTGVLAPRQINPAAKTLDVTMSSSVE